MYKLIVVGVSISGIGSTDKIAELLQSVQELFIRSIEDVGSYKYKVLVVPQNKDGQSAGHVEILEIIG